eukprot:s299_g16.t1
MSSALGFFLHIIWILTFVNKILLFPVVFSAFDLFAPEQFDNGDCIVAQNLETPQSPGQTAVVFAPKASATHCEKCQLHWHQALDRSYVHGIKQPKQPKQQNNYAAAWGAQQPEANYQGGQTPRGRGQGGKSPRKGGNTPKGKGPAAGDFQFPMPPQFPYPMPYQQMMPPLPPPQTPPPWMTPVMTGQQMMASPMPSQPAQMPQTAPQMMPNAQAFPMMPMAMPAPSLPQSALDAQQKELIAYFRNRQGDLPPDMQQKMKDFTRKQGARITKDLQSAAKQLGDARTELEEALQARAQHIGTWKTFLGEAVKNWWSYANSFDQHERNLLARIAQAKEQFQEAKECLEESKIAAGTLTEQEKIQEISDDDVPPGDSDLSANQIQEGIQTLTTSLQQLQKDADSIEVEQFASNKRPRVDTPATGAPGAHGDVAMPGDQNSAGQHFGGAGHA